jgi:hypothetical protein
MSEVVPFARTLEQEVLALFRGASMECLVCGEFVMRSRGGLTCPECASVIRLEGGQSAQLGLDIQAG